MKLDCHQTTQYFCYFFQRKCIALNYIHHRMPFSYPFWNLVITNNHIFFSDSGNLDIDREQSEKVTGLINFKI